MSNTEVGTAYVALVPTAKGFAAKMQAEIGGDIGRAGAKGGDDYSRQFGERAKRGLGSRAKGIFGPLIGAAAGFIAFDKAKNFLSGAVDEASEAAVVGARTSNVIRKMGADAWTSADRIGDLSAAISAKVGVDDEAIQAGNNMLLTFGKVRNEAGRGNKIFDQASRLMVDMSRAMGTDMKGSAIQLGKALNDPIKGAAALSRVGVQFTAKQKEQIKTLVESGKTLQAQKIILGEVKKQFGGAAEAMATPADRAKVSWGNLQEQIGTAVLPLINKVSTWFADRAAPAISQFITEMQDGTGKGGQFVSTLRDIAAKAADVAGYLNDHRGVVIAVIGAYAAYRVALVGIAVAQRVVSAATAVATGVQAAYGAVVALSRSYVATWVGVKALELAAWIKTTAATVAGTAATVASAAATRVAAAGAKAWAAAQWLLNAAMTANPIGLVVAGLVLLVGGLILAYKKSETFRNVVNAAFGAVMRVVRPVVNWFRTYVPMVFAIMVKAVRTYVTAYWTVIRTAFNIARAVVVGAVNAVRAVVSRVWGFIAEAVRRYVTIYRTVVVTAFNVVRGAVTQAMGAVRSIVSGIWNGLVGIIRGGGNRIVGAVRAIPGMLLSLGRRFGNAGRDLIQAFIRGLGRAGGAAADFASSIWNAVRSAINSGIDRLNGLLQFDFKVKGVGFTVDAPDIPHLATGGRATGGTLAVIGEGSEPETVLPDSVLAGFLARMTGAAVGALGGGGTFAFTITNWEDGEGYFEEIAGGVVDDSNALADQGRRAR